MIRDDTTVRPLEATAADLMVVHPKSYLDSLKVIIYVSHHAVGLWLLHATSNRVIIYVSHHAVGFMAPSCHI